MQDVVRLFEQAYEKGPRRPRASMSLPLPDLGLAGDGDVHDMVRDVERAFGVDFGDRFCAWTTVGDIEAALLPLFPSSPDRGRCAVAMAFYALRRGFSLGHDAGPFTRLETLRRGSAIGALGELECDLGLRMPKIAPSTAGLVGIALFWLGLPGIIGLHFLTRAWWHGPTLVALGLLLWGTNRGSFENRTLGDLARDLALLNYGTFAARGADRRPETIWRAIRHIVCRQTDVDPNAVARTTRILAER